MADALADEIEKQREGMLLMSAGRGRRNLPPIPSKYRRQVYLRMLAGLYADSKGNPLAIGDKVIHENPKIAAKRGEGVVVGKVQGGVGGLQRAGVVYIDYVRVQYPDGSIEKYVSRFQRHVDSDVAKQRFDAEPRINWMNQEEMDIALAERRKKPRKNANEALDAADAEVEEIAQDVRNVSEGIVPEPAEGQEAQKPAYEQNIEWFKANAQPVPMRAGDVKVGDFIPTRGDKNIGRVVQIADLDRAVRIEVEFPGGKRWPYNPMDKNFELQNIYRLDNAEGPATSQVPAPQAPAQEAAPAVAEAEGPEVPQLPEIAKIDLRGAKKAAQALAARIKDKPVPNLNADENIVEFNKQRLLDAIAPENDRRRDKGLNLGLDEAIRIAKTFGWYEEAQELMAIRQRKSNIPFREMPEDFMANVQEVRNAFELHQELRRDAKALRDWRNRQYLDQLRNAMQNVAIHPDVYNPNFRAGVLGGRNAITNLVDNIEREGNNPELAQRFREFGKLFDAFGDLPKMPIPKGLENDEAAQRLARIAQDLAGQDVQALRNGVGDWAFTRNLTDGINGLYLLRNRVTGEQVLVKYDNDHRNLVNGVFLGSGINAEEMVAKLYRDLGFAQPAFQVLNPDMQDMEHRGVGLMEFADDGFFGLVNAGQINKRPEANRIDAIAPEFQEEVLNFVVANGIIGNTDRHGKNIMVGQDENGLWRLIPIDNGLAIFNGGFQKAENNADNPLHLLPDRVIRGDYGNRNAVLGVAKQWIDRIGRDAARNQVIEFAERMRKRAEILEFIDQRANEYLSARAQWIIDNVDQYLDAIR
jgi:hypothetical protein